MSEPRAVYRHESLCVPPAVLAQHAIALGKTGSGKSSKDSMYILKYCLCYQVWRAAIMLDP